MSIAKVGRAREAALTKPGWVVTGFVGTVGKGSDADLRRSLSVSTDHESKALSPCLCT